MPSTRDTLSVIHDLSRAVRNNPEAVDIYMALGNLFRSKGDIQHAVLIRERLMARPELDAAFKARASFELGQDYRRAGVVDRAQTAYREAARLGYNGDLVTAELANLFAESGSFELAAAEYSKLGHYLGEAHYMVRAAEEQIRSGDSARAARTLKKATKVYPGSVEAWSAILVMHAKAGEWRKTASILKQALGRVSPKLQFLLLEALLGAIPAAGAMEAPALPPVAETPSAEPEDSVTACADEDSAQEENADAEPGDAGTPDTPAVSVAAQKLAPADPVESEYVEMQEDSSIPDSFTQSQNLLGKDLEDSRVLEDRKDAVTHGSSIPSIIAMDKAAYAAGVPAAPSASSGPSASNGPVPAVVEEAEPLPAPVAAISNKAPIDPAPLAEPLPAPVAVQPAKNPGEEAARAFAASLGAAVIPVLEKQEPAILLHYYGGLLLKYMGDTANAAIWFSKALVVQPQFWAARLELLRLAAQDGELSSTLALQVDSLAEELGHIKRFYCTACGLRQEGVFYRCPRCGSWHSISYRLSLQE